MARPIAPFSRRLFLYGAARTRGRVELKRIVVAVACGVGLTLPLSAASATTGSSGGAYPTVPATIKSVSCVAGCASAAASQQGSLLRIRGSDMRHVAKIVFLGGAGHDDNVTVKALRTRTNSVDVAVPARALTGRLRSVNADGARSAASGVTVQVRRRAPSAALVDVGIIGRRVFYDASQPARIDLLARRAMSVTVALVRPADGATLMSWPLTLSPEVGSSVTWDGRLGGQAQPPGRYVFQVLTGEPAVGVVAAQAPAILASGAFELVDHIFPVRGNHTYGSGAAAFGAQRDGHTHEGHDVFARCGTPLVAARGGIVKLNRFEASAGNYIVIDGEGTDVDYAYMHLREPSPLAKGARVLTGQPIGTVGDTGDAHGCHLHFEMWSGPGWYTGGAPQDPLAALTAWDAYS